MLTFHPSWRVSMNSEQFVRFQCNHHLCVCAIRMSKKHLTKTCFNMFFVFIIVGLNSCMFVMCFAISSFPSPISPLNSSTCPRLLSFLIYPFLFYPSPFHVLKCFLLPLKDLIYVSIFQWMILFDALWVCFEIWICEGVCSILVKTAHRVQVDFISCA